MPRLIVPLSAFAFAHAVLPLTIVNLQRSASFGAMSCTATGSEPFFSHQFGDSGTGLPVEGQATVRAQTSAEDILVFGGQRIETAQAVFAPCLRTRFCPYLRMSSASEAPKRTGVVQGGLEDYACDRIQLVRMDCQTKSQRLEWDAAAAGHRVAETRDLLRPPGPLKKIVKGSESDRRSDCT